MAETKTRFYKIWLMDGRIDYICGRTFVEVMRDFGYEKEIPHVQKWEEK